LHQICSLLIKLKKYFSSSQVHSEWYAKELERLQVTQEGDAEILVVPSYSTSPTPTEKQEKTEKLYSPFGASSPFKSALPKNTGTIPKTCQRPAQASSPAQTSTPARVQTPGHVQTPSPVGSPAPPACGRGTPMQSWSQMAKQNCPPPPLFVPRIERTVTLIILAIRLNSQNTLG